MATPRKELLELHTQREAGRPELARQLRQRRAKKADGDIHKVDREVHPSRTQEAAELNEVDRGPVRRWQRAAALVQMPPPPGYHIEWVRRDNRNRGDHANLLAHIQEGWEPCGRKDFPKAVLPTQRLTDLGEVIGNDNSILMKIPLELKAQRDAFYNSRRDKATRGIDSSNEVGLTQAQDPRMPIVENININEGALSRVPKMRRRVGGGVVRVADD